MTAPENLLAAITGLLAHNLIFIRGEWHRQASELCALSFALPLVLWALESRHNNFLTLEALQHVFSVTSSFFAGLFISIVVYRLMFHPLRKYPGPFLARITKLWHFYHCRNTQNHLLMERLRKRYGNHVRVGKSVQKSFYLRYNLLLSV
jgi:hypothetical protein